ncbi:cytochrome P450 [Cypionkella sp.]|uniref:cytochrome P450 n=1 Tax=Cypionkella sp. TaxID=2811411 RepID=UPI00262D1AD7|nr:cytochrome P450 [Cypionkella sp.]MDB5665762.1 cytochrome [Cypionkella sp.]
MTRAPGPKGTLIWGSLGAVQKDALGFLTQAAASHGDVVRLRFGPVIAHLLNHPDHIEHVLSRGAQGYDKDTRSVAQIKATCGASLLSSDGAAWQRHRRLIQPVFQPRFLDTIDPVVDTAIDAMLDRWAIAARNATPIDIVAEMMQLMIVISVRFLFSSEVDPDRIDRALKVLLADTWRRLEALFDPSMISPRLHRPAFKQALAEIDAVVFALIRARRQSGTQPDDLLSRLLSAHEGEGLDRLTDTELRDAAVTLILAGHETVANALAWAIVLLAQNPEWRRHDPHKVWSETLRLFPSIWIMERRAVTLDEIGGYRIAKGSTVLMSPYVLHRNPQFWPNADRFDPTRFDETTVATRPRHAYLPFGLGPHRCIGLHLGNRVAERILTQVQAAFRLDLAPGQSLGLAPGITLRHADAIYMYPREAAI